MPKHHQTAGRHRDHSREIQVRRAYDEPEKQDGYRVLVDRLWPRGVSKERADLDEWLKEVAPSKELRLALHEGKADYDDFTHQYDQELADNDHAGALDHLRELTEERPVTLVTAVKDMDHSHIPVLLSHLDATGALDSGQRVRRHSR